MFKRAGSTRLLHQICPGCKDPGPAPCAACIAQLTTLGQVAAPGGVDSCWALLDYDDAARSLIAPIKHHNNRAPLPWFGLALANLLRSSVGDDLPAACTWAPTNIDRRRQRGFDHAELLAHSVARHLDLPVDPLLKRCDRNHQTGASRAQRLSGPTVVARSRAPAGVLLIDDISTTGSTLSRSAHALRNAGCVYVVAATLAHRRWQG